MPAGCSTNSGAAIARLSILPRRLFATRHHKEVLSRPSAGAGPAESKLFRGAASSGRKLRTHRLDAGDPAGDGAADRLGMIFLKEVQPGPKADVRTMLQ